MYDSTEAPPPGTPPLESVISSLEDYTKGNQD